VQTEQLAEARDRVARKQAEADAKLAEATSRITDMVDNGFATAFPGMPGERGGDHRRGPAPAGSTPGATPSSTPPTTTG